LLPKIEQLADTLNYPNN